MLFCAKSNVCRKKNLCNAHYLHLCMLYLQNFFFKVNTRILIPVTCANANASASAT